MSPEECIDKLEQLVIDENELVNYKVLSKELKIHVNEAKKYLYDFLKIQNSKKDVKLHAYFFLSGFVVKNDVKTRKLIIVSEDNLEKVKKGFEEITSCHIYALNKGAHKDDSLLFNSQSWCKKWAEEHREYSAIKHPSVVIQAPVIKKTETTKNISKPLPSKSTEIKQSNTKGASSLFKNESKAASPVKENPNEKIIKTSHFKDEPIKPATTAKPESSEKKSVLSNLWQKLEEKSKNGKCDNSKVDTKGKKGPAKTVGKNNIMSMFSKQAEKNANNPTKKSDTSSSPAKKVSLPVEISTNKVSPKTNNIVEDKKATGKSSRKASQRKTKRNSKQTSDNDSEEEYKPKKKKHKRICTMDDSDSDSETEEAQDRAQRSLLDTEEPADVAMPVSDDSEEPIPPTPPVVSNKGKNKVWKTVQKTFQDEEGFLVAKQEKVLVSASDSDEDPLPSKNNEQKKEPKENSFSYRKQASLTSFFKQR